METLPLEILLQIASNAPAVWRGMLVVRSFAEASLCRKFKKTGLKKLDLWYGCIGGEYKKNYIVENSECEGTTPSTAKDCLHLPKYIFRAFKDPEEWFKSLHLPLIVPIRPWGYSLGCFLSGLFMICRKLNELGVEHKGCKTYRLKPGVEKSLICLKIDNEITVETDVIDYTIEYYTHTRLQIAFVDEFIDCRSSDD